MLPNILGPLTVVATFGVATAVLLESSLSFLGLGVRPPEASWGNLITEAISPRRPEYTALAMGARRRSRSPRWCWR